MRFRVGTVWLRAPLGDPQQAGNRQAAARLIRRNAAVVQGFDGFRGVTVHAPGAAVVVVVAEVGADHYERLRAAPEALQDLRHLLGGRAAHHQRHEREVAED